MPISPEAATEAAGLKLNLAAEPVTDIRSEGRQSRKVCLEA